MSSGEISSAYPNNAVCVWLVSTSSSNNIILKFSSLALELNNDYIAVDICTSPSNCDISIGTVTGTTIGLDTYYTSQTGHLQAKLISDESVVGSFVSSWSVVCPPPKCDTGSTGPDGGPCLACPAGQYKDVAGSAACTICGAGKYSPTEGASRCVVCPSGTISPAGSSAAASCVCGVGYQPA
jgi:hypothetical protein